jgi:hypothetical protein
MEWGAAVAPHDAAAQEIARWGQRRRRYDQIRKGPTVHYGMGGAWGRQVKRSCLLLHVDTSTTMLLHIVFLLLTFIEPQGASHGEH